MHTLNVMWITVLVVLDIYYRLLHSGKAYIFYLYLYLTLQYKGLILVGFVAGKTALVKIHIK